MCGRFAQYNPSEKLGAEFDIDEIGKDLPKPSYNIKPTQMIAVVAESAKGTDTVRRLLEPARWSLIPPWVTDGKPKFSTFNARSEDAASKASWKNSVTSKRCIIPASGYYEWVTAEGVKTPHYIRAKDHDATLALAGLYSWWRASESAPWLLTATILTMATVPELADVHDRNPVTLPREFWATWLDPTIVGDQALVDAAVAEARPVAASLVHHAVGPVTGDGPELILPAPSE